MLYILFNHTPRGSNLTKKASYLSKKIFLFMVLKSYTLILSEMAVAIDCTSTELFLEQ